MGAVGAPLKDGKGPRAQFTLGGVILLEHLDVGVLGEAGLADGGEVGGFPAGAVQVLFDLGWHLGGWRAVRATGKYSCLLWSRSKETVFLCLIFQGVMPSASMRLSCGAWRERGESRCLRMVDCSNIRSLGVAQESRIEARRLIKYQHVLTTFKLRKQQGSSELNAGSRALPTVYCVTYLGTYVPEYLCT